MTISTLEIAMFSTVAAAATVENIFYLGIVIRLLRIETEAVGYINTRSTKIELDTDILKKIKNIQFFEHIENIRQI